MTAKKFTESGIIHGAFQVLLGSLSTILLKILAEKLSENSTGEKSAFNHPFLESSGQFFFEMLWIIIYWIFRLFHHCYIICQDEEDQWKDIESSPDEEEGATEARPSPAEKVFSHENGFSYKKSWMLIFPAFTDFCLSSMLYMGLSLTTPSSYQMLRGSAVIFTALLSRMFLGRKLKTYKWFAVVIVAIGVFTVGLSNYSGQNHSPLGDILVVGAMLLSSIQVIYEEGMLKSLNLKPIQVLGWEGLYGFTLSIFVLVVFSYIETNNPTWGHSPVAPYYLEDPKDGLIQLYNSPSLMSTYIFAMIFVSLQVYCGLALTKEVSANARVILDTVRTLLVWAFSLGLGMETFNVLQPIGFGLMVTGICLYYDLVFLPLIKKLCKCLCKREEDNSTLELNTIEVKSPN